MPSIGGKTRHYKKETDPLGYYIAVVEDVGGEEDYNSENIEELLSSDEATFDDDGTLADDGFTIDSETDPISGIYWTQNASYRLDPRRNIYTRETLYDTNFKFDIDNDLIYIGSGLSTKADQLVNVLESVGVSVREIGSHGYFIHPDHANAIFENFVEELKEQTSEPFVQTSIEETTSDDHVPDEPRPSLEIYSVEMLAEDESLDEITINGKSDIFDDGGVTYFIENRGGKVTSIQGKFDHREQAFTFQAGYGGEDNLGRLSVTKRGSASIDPTLVDECFDFLSSLYIKHFVHFESYEP